MASLEDYPDSEIQGIWKRVKVYIDTNEVKVVGKDALAQELKQRMLNPVKTSFQSNPQASLDFLVAVDFHLAAAKNSEIQRELLKRAVISIQVKGKTRYRIAKGIKDGKNIRGGRFLRGKTQDEALDDLFKKAQH